jgi:hypothetical protein
VSIGAAGGFPTGFLVAPTRRLRILRICIMALPAAAKGGIDGWDGTNITTVTAIDGSRGGRRDFVSVSGRITLDLGCDRSPPASRA